MTERDFDITSLLDDLRANPDAIMEYSEEELKKLQNKIFEHGVIKLPQESYAAISIINWRDNYLRKLHFTSLIGYVFRLVKELDGDALRENSSSASLTKSVSSSIVDSVFESALQYRDEDKGYGATTLESNFKKESATNVEKMLEPFIKAQVEAFFRRHFEFDPDKHVESAFKENLKDPERVSKYADMRVSMNTTMPTAATVDNTSSIDTASVDDKIKQLYQSLTVSESLLASSVSAIEKHKKSEASRNQAVKELSQASRYLSMALKGFADAYGKGADFLSDDIKAAVALAELHSESLLGGADMADASGTVVDNFSHDDLSGLLSKKHSEIEEEARKLYFLAPKLLEEIKGAYDWIPSTNVFYHWDRYLSNHYEQLREATGILYNEKPDIEFQLQYYGSFDTPDAAKEFERKYESNVITSVYTIQNGGWTILGPFKENRSRIDFYNKNTEIIKRMFEQAESDQALGKDLMQKRIKRAKKQNILDAGPDDPGLAKYKAAVTTIEALGAKEGLTREEKDELAKAYREKEMAEVPDDAIQVDVFGPDGKGGLKKSHFYSQAEAPEFMEQNIADQHDRMRAISQGGLLSKQPKQNDDDSGSLKVRKPASPKEKTVTSRDGKVRTIAELKSSLTPANPN